MCQKEVLTASKKKFLLEGCRDKESFDELSNELLEAYFAFGHFKADVRMKMKVIPQPVNAAFSDVEREYRSTISFYKDYKLLKGF